MTEKVNRWEIAKILIGPGIALFVAVVGWILAERYNANQLKIANQRNDADIEVARINAALRYMDFLQQIPEDDVIQQRQAITIAAPVLPPELAFRLAVEQLPDDTAALDTLMAKYREQAFGYLVATLEVPFAEVSQTISIFSPSSPYAEAETEREKVARNLLRYLRLSGHAEQLFSFLISREYENEHFRPIALLFYFDNYRDFLRSQAGYVVQQAYENVRIEQEFASLLSDRRLSRDAKRAVAFSVSIVFGKHHESQSDVFSRQAAELFWDGYDIGRGGTPEEGTLEGHMYSRVFHFNEPPGTNRWVKRDAVDLASKSLRSALLALKPGELEFGNVRLILYAYAESETVGRSAPYLMPADVVAVVRAMLEWADTPQKRQELSMEFGSLGGDHLFRNLLPHCLGCPKEMQADEIAARCKAARDFGEMLADWYAEYHREDWYIPKFFYSVLVEFPDLADEIDRQALGVGGPDGSWESETSRGCRTS